MAISVQKLWPSMVRVSPRRRVGAPQYARATEGVEGAIRLLSHKGARNIIQSLTVSADRPFAVECAVPRLSDDHIAAVFWGEPVEGL